MCASASLFRIIGGELLVCLTGFPIQDIIRFESDELRAESELLVIVP